MTDAAWLAVFAGATALLLTALLGLMLIPALRRLKFGQSILEDGPKWHMSKQGTPTMGGLMFIIAITVAVVAFGWNQMLEGDTRHLLVLGLGLIYGLIGLIDDWFKVRRKKNKGLTALQKLILQIVAAAAFLILLRLSGFLLPNLYIPFFNVTWALPELVFIIFAIIYIVGFVNAVNLTDGVDGLCSGVTLPVAVVLAALAFAWSIPSLGILSAALAGGMLGFLIFNFHPARVFMGDTGSLFLGGILCGIVFALDAPLLLIPMGVLYLVEMFSVMLQVTYFKLTHGKRLFKMSPIHHHFEMSGWSETKLFWVFLGFTAVVCALTYWASYQILI